MPKAEEISGWMTHDELAEIRRRGALAQTIVELGSWHGRSTMAWAESCPGIVYAVDWFKGNPLEAADRDCAQAAYNGAGPVAFHAFSTNLKPHLESGKVRLLPFESSFAARYLQLRHVQVDLVFVDAGHDLNSVVIDIANWKLRLAKKGYFLGHDWPEVSLAVQLLLPTAHPLGIGGLWEWRPPEEKEGS
jgi:methyltransferase family protein